MKYRSWLFFQHFLNHYGYISNTRSGNHDVGTAVRQFQEFYGLQVSGRLDAATVRLMKKPRCGMSDPTPGGRLRRYVTLGKWSKTYLKFFVQPGEDLPHVSTIWSLGLFVDVSKLSILLVCSLGWREFLKCPTTYDLILPFIPSLATMVFVMISVNIFWHLLTAFTLEL